VLDFRYFALVDSEDFAEFQLCHVARPANFVGGIADRLS